MTRKPRKTKQEKRRLKATRQAEHARQLLETGRNDLMGRAMAKAEAMGNMSGSIRASDIVPQSKCISIQPITR